MTLKTKVVTLGPGLLHFDDPGSLKDASAQVTKCSVVPSVSTGSPVIVLTGDAVPGERKEAWKIKGTIFQDLGATQSLCEWFFENRGKPKPVKFVPSTAAGKAISGTVIIEAVELGGQVGENATTDFEFDFVGAPSIGAA